MRMISDQLSEERMDGSMPEGHYYDPLRHGRLMARPRTTLRTLPTIEEDHGDELQPEVLEVAA